MSEPITLLDALTAALARAGSYNKNDQCPPAAILWPDKERQWEPLLPALRERLPLLTLGPYAPLRRTGPAYWLRCMIARTLPDDVLPADAVPIIYLPGVSRAEIRAIEECPKPLQPLAELQYRGVLWTHKNGRDWTVAGFLQSTDGGLGIAVSGDTATKEALGRALLKLAYEPVARLKKEAPLKAAFFDELLNPDQARRLLLWLNDPDGLSQEPDAGRVVRVLRTLQAQLRLPPRGRRRADRGRTSRDVAGRLGDRLGPLQREPGGVSQPAGTPAPGAAGNGRSLKTALPYWPQDTETAEADLRAALLALGDCCHRPTRAAHRAA